MTSGRYGLVLREVGRLLGGGTVGSLGAGQLLERFAVDRDEAAFEALVTRHGPMVLGTCRRMLADPHDVDDAFQATFLVLARKAGSIQDADRLGPWLHGVARRVATRSRALSSRRKSVERQGVNEPAAESPDLLEDFEIREVLDEELSRLPDKYRAPLVLCYLEGLTHDEAAQQLRWPVGTVRSRLAGGRDRLRSALTRRGLAPSAAVPAFLHSISIPQALLTTTVRVATSAGSPSMHVLNLAKGVLIAMSWNKLKLIAALGLTAGLTVGGAGVAAQKGEEGKAEAQAPAAEPSKDRSTPEGQPDKGRSRADRLNPLQRREIDLKIRLSEATMEFEQLEREFNTPRREGPEERIKELETQLAAMLESIKANRARYKPAPKPATSPSAADLRKELDIASKEAERLAAELKESPSTNHLLQKRLETSKAIVPAPPTDPAEPKPPITSPLLTTGDKPGPGPSPNVPTPEERKANPRPRSANPMVMQLGEDSVLVIPSEQDRVTILNTKTGTRVTQRFPDGMTAVTPVVSPGMVALFLKGPEVRQVAAYDIQGGKWYPQDLQEPTTEASPVTGFQTAYYQLGRFLYVFSAQAKKWGVLELKHDPGRGQVGFTAGGGEEGKMMIPEGDLIHLYDAKTGEWTHIDTRDDQPKMEATPKPSVEPRKIEAPIGPGGETGKTDTRVPQPEVFPLPGEPKLFASISAARDQVTIFDPEAKTRKIYRTPNGVKVGSIQVDSVTALNLVGPEIAQLVVFDRRSGGSGEWSTQDLKRPVSGKSVELRGPGRTTIGSIQLVKYEIDGTIYLYNPRQSKWTSLDLSVPTSSPMHIDGELATLIDGDLIHIYDARTAEWKHINTKDDK